MTWYYLKDGERAGPVERAELDRLVQSGALTSDVMVWSEGMSEWAAYPGPPAPTGAAAGAVACSVCGRSFPPDEVVRIERSAVCADCKPGFVQGMREGVTASGDVEYGGFWIRAAAKFVDGIILWMFQTLVNMVLLPIIASSGSTGNAALIAAMLMMLFNYAVLFLYGTFFVGRFGATPGKMACRLRVVTSSGDRVSYLRAFARSLSEIVSSILFGIGYLIAAFDEQKRTLHDRMCDTRVIKKK